MQFAMMLGSAQGERLKRWRSMEKNKCKKCEIEVSPRVWMSGLEICLFCYRSSKKRKQNFAKRDQARCVKCSRLVEKRGDTCDRCKARSGRNLEKIEGEKALRKKRELRAESYEQPKIEKKTRKCLKCDKEFESINGLRICQDCKRSRSEYFL